jgi:hypothetical protein
MKTIKMAAVMLVLVLMPACTKKVNGPTLHNNAIQVTADVTQHTKAGYESGVLLPEKFIMDIIQGDIDRFNYPLVEMTRNANSNEYTPAEGTELLWADDSYKAEIKAMTVPPGSSGVTSSGVMTINVSLEQNETENVAASDLLGATTSNDGGISIESGKVKIEFQHLLSKLDVKYTFAEEYAMNEARINSITLQNVCTQGGYSYAEMEYESTDLGYDDIIMYNNTSTSTAEAIFYPYKPVNNPTLLINATIDGIRYNFTCPVVAKDANGFLGGRRYTMNISIVGSSVNGTDASIANGWDTNTEEESFITK